MGCVGSVNGDMRPDLLALGWNQTFEDAAQKIDSSFLIGRVSRLDRGWSTIKMSASDDQSGIVRVRNIGAGVAVGDWVAFEKNLERIEQVLPRCSALIRRASSDAVRAEQHAVAANIDTVFIVHAATNESNQRRVERELGAERSEAPRREAHPHGVRSRPGARAGVHRDHVGRARQPAWRTAGDEHGLQRPPDPCGRPRHVVHGLQLRPR